MYIAYKIIERNAVSNTTKLKVIFHRRDQMLLVIIFHFITFNKSFKRNIEKKEKKVYFVKDFLEKINFSIKFQMNFVGRIAPPRK